MRNLFNGPLIDGQSFHNTPQENWHRKPGAAVPAIIRLSRGERLWMAEHEADAEVLRLFGSYTIPTPYGVETSSQEVIRRIQQLNPTKAVILG